MKVCAQYTTLKGNIILGTAPLLGRVVCSAALLCLINETCSAPGSHVAADAPAKLITLADLHRVRHAGQVPQPADEKPTFLPWHFTMP